MLFRSDPYDLCECERVLKEELAVDAPSVIISRRPCALLKYVKHRPSFHINADKCIGCRSCMKIGCPSISIVPSDNKAGHRAEIDATQCVGCGVCQQMCRFDAIESANGDTHAPLPESVNAQDVFGKEGC